MTQIDFYVLPSNSSDARYRYTCRLTEKAYRLGRKVIIKTDSARQNKIMDDLLWTFRAGSFIPHCVGTDHDAVSEVPVVVGQRYPLSEQNDLLINLSPEIPDDFSRFQRLIEVIDENIEVRSAARERYRHYKDQGLEINTHKIAAMR